MNIKKTIAVLIAVAACTATFARPGPCGFRGGFHHGHHGWHGGWGHHHGWHHGWGWGVGGFAAGVVTGSLLNRGYYGYGYPAPVVAPAPVVVAPSAPVVVAPSAPVVPAMPVTAPVVYRTW